MPVLAQFSPQGNLGDSMSLMERAESARRAAAQEARQAAEFEIMEPVIRAKANADLMKTATDIEAAKAMENQRQIAYTLKPNADRQFNAIITETNPDVREGLARDWMGAYSQLDNVKEFEPEMKGKKDILARILTESSVLRQLNDKQDAATEIQQAKLENDKALADLKASHQAELDAEKTARANDTIAARSQMQKDRFEAAGGVEQQKVLGKNIATQVAAVTEAVPKNYDTLSQIRRARSLLDSGTEQGRGENAILETQKAINTFIPGLFDTANKESLKNTYAEMALQAASKMRGQGQITENERRLLADTAAQFGNTPEAARYIMDYMEAAANREIARADYLAGIIDEGRAVTLKDMNKFFADNPLEGKFLKTKAPAAQGAASNPNIDKLLDKYQKR